MGENEEKMDYLERMWDLYIRVYERPRYRKPYRYPLKFALLSAQFL